MELKHCRADSYGQVMGIPQEAYRIRISPRIPLTTGAYPKSQAAHKPQALCISPLESAVTEGEPRLSRNRRFRICQTRFGGRLRGLPEMEPAVLTAAADWCTLSNQLG